jgi:glycine/D-amino acid oxidase-like deaminating enzyme
MSGQDSVGDVIVVGAGVVGAAVVWRLAQEGLRVLWVTGPGSAGSGSAAAGAMLAVYSEVTAHQDGGVRDLEVTTRRQGRELWDTWLPEVAEVSGEAIDVNAGIHVIARGAQDAANLDAIRAAAASFGGRCEEVAPDDVPGLTPDRGWEPSEAVLLADEASLDGGQLLRALHAANRAQTSVTVVEDHAVRVEVRGAVTTATGAVLSAPSVVLAAGVQTTDLLAASGLDRLLPSLFSGRGVSLLVQSPESVPGCIRTPNRSFACGLHVVPRAGGRTYLGATNRFTTQPSAGMHPSLGELDDLIGSGVRELDTRMRRAEVVATTVGHRPVAMDRLPLVGRTEEPAILLATGSWRNGFVLAPMVADLIADELSGQEPESKHPFAATRPIAMPALDPPAIRRAAEGIADTLLGGGTLAAGRNADLVEFLHAALTSEIDAPDGDRAVARLLERAPMEEVLPLVFDLLVRRRRR